MKKVKQYFKRLWAALWASTELDEQIAAVYKEAERRVELMKIELEDVKNAAKNVASQSKDVFDATKGKKRRGRKPYYKKKKNNTKK